MKAPCRRCLLHELESTHYFRSIYEYIEHLSPEIKTPDDEYQRRLAICKSCDHLVNGMCEKCGCFVEVRAAKKDRRCSLTDNLW